MITYWPSPAKINLFLYITGQREDGYHTLQTLFQFIDYGDIVSIKVRDDGKIRLLTPLKGVPKKNNLILRAARILMHQAKRRGCLPVHSGAEISIKKNLPIGSGLGGGSSNAATILVALNHLWKCGLSKNELRLLGGQLGSDVPVFLEGHSALGEGVGEILTPIKLKERWYLVAYPDIQIPTIKIFKDPELPRNSPVRSVNTLLQSTFQNDCEMIVRKHFKEVDMALSWLVKYAPSRLTGTGSCVFSEFDTEFEARKILDQIPDFLCGFVARGINTSPLYRVSSILA